VPAAIRRRSNGRAASRDAATLRDRRGEHTEARTSRRPGAAAVRPLRSRM
jgi:hypothetical protein